MTSRNYLAMPLRERQQFLLEQHLPGDLGAGPRQKLLAILDPDNPVLFSGLLWAARKYYAGKWPHAGDPPAVQYLWNWYNNLRSYGVMYSSRSMMRDIEVPDAALAVRNQVRRHVRSILALFTSEYMPGLAAVGGEDCRRLPEVLQGLLL